MDFNVATSGPNVNPGPAINFRFKVNFIEKFTILAMIVLLAHWEELAVSQGISIA
jgi:hypothetical protein